MQILVHHQQGINALMKLIPKKTEEWHRPASSVSAYTSLTFDIFVNSLFVLMWN